MEQVRSNLETINHMCSQACTPYTIALIVSLFCVVASSHGNVGEEGGACGMRRESGPCHSGSRCLSNNHAESLGPDSPLESASQPLQPRNNREAPGMDQQTTGGSVGHCTLALPAPWPCCTLSHPLFHFSVNLPPCATGSGWQVGSQIPTLFQRNGLTRRKSRKANME